MADIVYTYYKELPQFRPNKFDIVGGFESNNNINKFVDKIGGYYGGEYEIDVSELDNIEFDTSNKIIAVGGYDSEQSGNKSASTVEPGLLQMFSNIDKRSKIVKTPKNKRKRKVMKNSNGSSGSGQEFLAKVPENTPPMKFSDITDEILYKCPNFNGGDDNLLENDENNKKENDYQLAVEIDNISSDSDDNEEYIEPIIPVTAAYEETNHINFDDDDTNIMQFLN